MEISLKDWTSFIGKMSKLSKDASDRMLKYVRDNGGYANIDTKELIGYATALAQKYGEGAATLAALMYDAIAELSGVSLPAADVAETVTYGEMAQAIQGAAKFSENDEYLSSIVGRFVKRAGADTTLKNAIRDGAEFAWIPHGDTCAFCIALAANGWQRASFDALYNGHAEHIHSNCDCMYAIRHNPNTEYIGYSPKYYQKMYDDAEGKTPTQKINAMRRGFYQQNKDEINARKRDAYAKQKELESSTAEEKYVE